MTVAGRRLGKAIGWTVVLAALASGTPCSAQDAAGLRAESHAITSAIGGQTQRARQSHDQGDTGVAASSPSELAYPPSLETEIGKYPGAALTFARTGAASVSAVLQSADLPDKVMLFYRTALVAKDWSITKDSLVNDMYSMKAVKDHNTLAINCIVVAGQGTVINVTLW